MDVDHYHGGAAGGHDWHSLGRYVWRNRKEITQNAHNLYHKLTKKGPSMPVHRKRKYPKAGSVGNEAGVSTTRAGVKKGKRLRKVRGKKSVKTSKVFRKKVHQVMDGDDIHGSFTRIVTNLGLNPASGNPLQSAIYDSFQSLPVTATNNANYTPWCFTPDQFLDAASIMWNNKAALNTVATLVPTVAGNFDFGNVIFTIKSAVCSFHIRNMTGRVVTLRVWNCHPRTRGGFVANAASNIPPYQVYSSLGAVTNDPESYVSATASFANAYTNDLSNGTAVMSEDGTTIAAGALNANRMPIWFNPTSLPTFRKTWKAEYTEYVLEGFQSVVHRIKGPSNVVYNGPKMFKGGIWTNIMPYSCCPFVEIVKDLAGVFIAPVPPINSAIGQPLGRFDNAQNAQFLAIERHATYRLSMPQQAGGATSLAPGVLGNTLLNRKPIFYRVTFGSQSNPATTGDGSVENPFVIGDE